MQAKLSCLRKPEQEAIWLALSCCCLVSVSLSAVQ